MTLFPDMVENGLSEGMIGRSLVSGLNSLTTYQIRDFSHLTKHHKVDDYTYGGGAGLLMQVQPIYDCYQHVKTCLKDPDNARVVFATPQGQVFDQEKARELAQASELVILCGRYEGVDERVIDEIVTDEISIGDYILTGGELPALILIDTISRNLNGVLGDPDGAFDDSHASYLLEYPHYTRPPKFRGWSVPDVLLSGNHAKINEWRRQQSLLRTAYAFRYPILR